MADLPEHLEATYGIGVERVRELDIGVQLVDRVHGPSWVARVFPAARDLGAVAGDAEILRHLEGHGFPAERCADPSPVSTHEGQAVLVTEYVAGRQPAAGPATYRRLGEMLGRLHALPAGTGAVGRPGGGWHHLALQGDPTAEVAAAAALLDDAGARVTPAHLGLLQEVRDGLGRLDDGHDLPQALLHPDVVPVNAVSSPGGDLVLVDWTGAGRGPRVWSLAFLLWAAGSRSPGCIDAAVAGYRTHVDLEPAELDRLADVMATRPLVLACWSFSTGRQTLADVAEGWEGTVARAAAVGARARAGLASSDG